jgi:hypothetical protein
MRRLLQLGLFLMSLNAISAFANTEQQEIDEYINTFNTGSSKAQTSACNELLWSGISDTRLYDVIERKLLEVLPTAAEDKRAIDLVAWYSKALGASGNDKYRKTLDKVVNGGHKKLAKYGQEGIAMLPDYKKWNPIISSTKNHLPGKSLQVNRFLNMLRSQEWDLKLLGTKRINYEKISDPDVLGVLKAEILKNYKSVTPDQVDTMQWMVRTLAALGAPQYLETIQEVSAKSTNNVLTKYADKIIKKYY